GPYTVRKCDVSYGNGRHGPGHLEIAFSKLLDQTLAYAADVFKISWAERQQRVGAVGVEAERCSSFGPAKELVLPEQCDGGRRYFATRPLSALDREAAAELARPDDEIKQAFLDRHPGEVRFMEPAVGPYPTRHA